LKYSESWPVFQPGKRAQRSIRRKLRVMLELPPIAAGVGLSGPSGFPGFILCAVRRGVEPVPVPTSP